MTNLITTQLTIFHHDLTSLGIIVSLLVMTHRKITTLIWLKKIVYPHILVSQKYIVTY